jgi:hypothetical protein
MGRRVRPCTVRGPLAPWAARTEARRVTNPRGITDLRMDRGRLVVVATTADGTAHRADDHEDQADYQHDDPERPKDWDSEEEPGDE